MTHVSLGDVEPSPGPSGPPTRRRLHALAVRELPVALGYVAAAVLVTVHLWRHLGTRMVAMAQDQVFFMWVLRHGARVIMHGDDPFLTYRLNAPSGVNLMANTSSLALSLPMTPVTVLLGPRVSFAALLVAGLAGTAYAWYLLLLRLVGRPAAVVGGAFCGFAPGMISQAAGHVNWVAQFLVPLLVLALLRLTEPGRAVRGGALLGLLVTLQAFVNEEVLLYTAIGCALLLLSYGAFLWRVDAAQVAARAACLARGLPVTAAVAGVLLAYPLSVQFFGPQAYHGLPEGVRRTGSDLASYWSFPGMSLAGGGRSQPLALNVTEENSFFGWPLLAVTVAAVAVLWRRILVRAVAVTAVVFLLFSLGPTLLVARQKVGVPVPWGVLGRLPLLESALPTRFSLALIPLFGVVLALAVQRLSAFPRRSVRLAGCTLLAAALLPLVPLPLRTTAVPTTPVFISSGHWTAYVPPDRTLVPVPDNLLAAMVWQADTDAGFAVPGGYFLGPDAAGRGHFGASPLRPTAALLAAAGRTGEVPAVTDRMRRDLRADLAYWRASVLVMPLRVPHAARLRDLVDELTGTAGQQVDDVVLWRA